MLYIVPTHVAVTYMYTHVHVPRNLGGGGGEYPEAPQF